MTTIIGLAVVVIAVTLVVLAGFIIPVFIEVRKTAAALREFITRTETELRPVLKELHEALTDIRLLTGETAGQVEDVKLFMEAVGDTGRNLRTINSVIGAVAGAIASSSMWLSGARVAGRFILDRISKKRG